jgi:hypothetical protein
MVEPLRHRQTKEAATDMLDLKSPRHTSTLPMLLKKDYEGGLLATLIQHQEQVRNHDSRNHLPGFVRFNF